MCTLLCPLLYRPGLCLCHLGRMEQADSTLAGLLSEPADQFGDLFLEVGNALIAMGHHGRAAAFLERLEPLPEFQVGGASGIA